MKVLSNKINLLLCIYLTCFKSRSVTDRLAGGGAVSVTYVEFIKPHPRGETSNMLAIHCYPGEQCYVARNPKDGSTFYHIHRPPLSSKLLISEHDKTQAISVESLLYPGYYMLVKNKKIYLEKPDMTNFQSKKMATFEEHHRVRTNSSMLQLLGKPYVFICNEGKKPWRMVTGVDDDSNAYASRCSFDHKKYKRKDATDEVRKQAANHPPKAGGVIPGEPSGEVIIPGTTGPVSRYVRFFIPGRAGLGPLLGIRALPFQRIRIAVFPDQLNVSSPGLNGIEGTYSFQSVKYPFFYLQRKGKDIFLESLKRNPAFYESATFNLEPQVKNDASTSPRIVIHPYNQPEWYLGHLHYPPFYVRALYNNNTAEFDNDVEWLLKHYQKKQIISDKSNFNLFKSLTNFLVSNHSSLSQDQINLIFKILHGSSHFVHIATDSMMDNDHNMESKKLLLSQLATINGLQDIAVF